MYDLCFARTTYAQTYSKSVETITKNRGEGGGAICRLESRSAILRSSQNQRTQCHSSGISVGIVMRYIRIVCEFMLYPLCNGRPTLQKLLIRSRHFLQVSFNSYCDFCHSLELPSLTHYNSAAIWRFNGIYNDQIK